MATIALPQGATKALSTPKGRVYAAGGAVALVVAAYLLLSGGDSTSTPTPAPAGTAVTTTVTTAAPATPTTAGAFVPAARNPFTKGDGSLPADK